MKGALLALGVLKGPFRALSLVSIRCRPWFAEETNRGRQAWFVSDLDELKMRLSRL